jgi:hypothetical protein
VTAGARVTGAEVRCRNPDRRGRAFAPDLGIGAPPRSRGFRSGPSGGPAARARNPVSDSWGFGPDESKLRKTRPETPTRSLRVSGSTRTIPLGPSGPGRAALPLDMTVSWAGAAGAASRSRSTSGSRMAARSSERSAGDGCLDPFARYRFLTGRRGAVRAPSRIRTRHAHAVPDPARQMMAQT